MTNQGNRRNYIVIRYDDLIANPEQVIRTIAKTLHIEYVRDLLEPTVAGIPSLNNSSFTRRTTTGEIDRAPTAHQEVLTGVERDMLAAIVGPAAEQFGYAVQPLHPWRARVLRVLSKVALKAP